ncbi:hypothetical protein Tco_0368671 [Tanacetum coccineum]
MLHDIWGELIQFVHTTTGFCTIKDTDSDQAGVQVSRQGETRQESSLWKRLWKDFSCVVFVHGIGTFAEVSSASALQVLRRLGSGCSGLEIEECLCKELHFSVVDNSKLNVVYLLNRSLKRFVSLLEGLQGGKRMLFKSNGK